MQQEGGLLQELEAFHPGEQLQVHLRQELLGHPRPAGHNGYYISYLLQLFLNILCSKTILVYQNYFFNILNRQYTIIATVSCHIWDFIDTYFFTDFSTLYKKLHSVVASTDTILHNILQYWCLLVKILSPNYKFSKWLLFPSSCLVACSVMGTRKRAATSLKSLTSSSDIISLIILDPSLSGLTLVAGCRA